MGDDTNRIRFESLDLQQRANARCSARVVLAWRPGIRFEGAAEGTGSPSGLLRCAADAAVRALEAAVDNRVMLDLLGVTTVKAFDAVIVVVSLASRSSEHEQRVVGSAVANGEPTQAAVRAVLNATNRLMGDNLIYLR